MSRECNYMKIFRPWDVTSEQDATISTTVDQDDDDVDSAEIDVKNDVGDDITNKSFSKSNPHRPNNTYEERKQTQDNLIMKKTCVTTDAELENSTEMETNRTKETKVKCSKLNVRKTTTNYSIGHQEHLIPPATNIAPLPTTTTDWYDPASGTMFSALGLTSTDAMLLEAASLAHGHHAAEEYARLLIGEERRARLHAAARKQRPKKYKCPHCDVGFSNNGQLKGHIRIHTGERPFRCDVATCGKTFTRNEELTRHKRIHSGLRPFPCTECGKRFGRKDHLKKHARTHAQHRAAAAVAAVYGMPMSVMPLPAMMMPSTPSNITGTPATASMAYDHWTHSHPAMGFLPPMSAPHPSQPPVLYGY